MIEKEELLEKRLTRVRTAIKRKEPDRVPIVLSYNTFGAFYYGYDVKEVYHNKPELIGEIHVKLGEEFPCDGFYSIGVSNHMLADPFGGGHVSVGSMGLQVSNTTCELMEVAEYEQFIANPITYFRDVLIPRKFKIFQTLNQEEAFQKLKESYDKFLFYTQKTGIGMKAIQDSGIPLLIEGGVMHPLDIILDFCRDFKGIMTDIRRLSNKVHMAIESITPFLLKNTFNNYVGKDDGRCLYWPAHIPTYLSPKQFEAFYFPYLKTVCENAIEKNGVIMLFMEGDWTQHYDVMQDLPDNEGNIIGMHEKCDLKKFKEVLGHKMCIDGGLNINLLGRGSKQQCIDETKKIIDDCAHGGGFLLGNATMFIGSSDIKPENLKSVIKTVEEYGKY